MVEFSVKHDMAKLQRQLSAVGRRQLPFATAKALTQTAKDVQRFGKRDAAKRLDRPKKFTLNALAVKPAKKRDLTARVFYREFAPKGTAAGTYLRPVEFGGPRRHKRFERALIAAGVMEANEYAVPARGARLNRHGNITAGTITKVLSQVRASPDAFQNVTETSAARRAAQGAATFFAPVQGLPRGIWRRRGKTVTPVMIFVRGAPTYTKTLKFRANADRFAQRRFPRRFRAAFRDALRTAR